MVKVNGTLARGTVTRARMVAISSRVWLSRSRGRAGWRALAQTSSPRTARRSSPPPSQECCLVTASSAPGRSERLLASNANAHRRPAVARHGTHGVAEAGRDPTTVTVSRFAKSKYVVGLRRGAVVYPGPTCAEVPVPPSSRGRYVGPSTYDHPVPRSEAPCRQDIAPNIGPQRHLVR